MVEVVENGVESEVREQWDIRMLRNKHDVKI